MDKTPVPCPECPGWFPVGQLKWHQENVHNANSEARWLARQGQGDSK